MFYKTTQKMGESTPICRCRVLYLGSAVPRQSKDGLQGIQEPLKSLYPSEGATGAKGIDSWLSVWSNGILLENVDENRKQVTRFFPIESLHYCAAVRQVLIPERGNTNPEPKFLPLDSPFARMPKAQHPPIFAAILRRTTGIKVLECHVFICKREAAANALVRCCFHAYADNSYARQLEGGGGGGGGISGGSVYGTLGGRSTKTQLTSSNHHNHINHNNSNHNDDLQMHQATTSAAAWRLRTESTTTLNSMGKQSSSNHHNHNNHNAHHLHHHLSHMNGGITTLNGGGNSLAGSNGSAAEGYTSIKNLYSSHADLEVVDDGEGSIYDEEENHKIWNGSHDQIDGITQESPYEMFSGGASTLGRPARARQISAPIPVPPPPLKEDTTKKKKEKRSSKHSSSQSLSGTLIRPKPIHADTLYRVGVMNTAVGPPSPGSVMYTPIGGQPSSRYFHTFSHKPFMSNGNIPGGLHGPHHAHHHHHHHHHLPPHPHHGPPIPGAAAALQMMPPPLPMPVMVSPQYATLQPGRTSKKKKQEKMNGVIPVGMPMPPPLFSYPPSMGPQTLLSQPPPEPPRPLSMVNRKLTQSVGTGLDDSGNSGAESPGGTGIYRKKGHLNERAFSYSIRQEHRSRSHGSLASLQFNPPDIKKEREIAQMMAGLELNDEIPAIHQESGGRRHHHQTFGQTRR